MTNRHLGLGLFLYPHGHHIAAWRDPAVPVGAATDLGQWLDIAEQAERSGLDFLFIADGNGMPVDDLAALQGNASRIVAQLEPVALLSALAVRTRRIGLIGTASTTYNEPYHVARRFASLDHISGGRAGWNIVTSLSDAEAWNFGLDRHPDHATRYRRASEFTEVVRGLWDSWEPDAFVFDKAAGRVFDPEKLHVLRHRGSEFVVHGPLNLPSTPQRHPVLFQAGASGTGLDFAARFADVAFTSQVEMTAAVQFRADLHRRASELGRPAGLPLVFAGVMPVVGRTRADAEARVARLDGLLPDRVVAQEASRALGGADLSGYDLDGPIPDNLPRTNRSQSLMDLMLGIGQAQGLSLRGIGTHYASSRGNLQLVGTGAEIAARMGEWFEAGAVDGFNLMPATLPDGFDSFATEVLPELQRRGLLADSPTEALTLRERLGLPPPPPPGWTTPTPE